ncbi:cobalamin-dependent protein [Alkalibacter rhizosphaerae]|uniref:Cobalamin-dependent protein n=1 Tax=Alkalibacter rhizosphaerae TaxID=2815577 RepID=A0A974XGN0_9FIRM|nr:cobalamin-dependent protein [Alkalibacter rhizosphaerae]QSX09512.1 cobalamin-dependent protein [Alkalibacter rhizosphaerae]
MIDLFALKRAIGKLEEDLVMKILRDFTETNPSEEEAEKAVAACQDGMEVIGDMFERGEYFVGDLIFAGELLTDAMEMLKSVMESKVSLKFGTIVVGTVHGDLHDIGKNIFISMVEAAGFEVYDMGIDQPLQAFVDIVKKLNPDIIGMSGVLTSSLKSMKDTVDALRVAGVRDSVKIIVGGNQVTKDVCELVGADAFTSNAAEGVKIVQEWMKATKRVDVLKYGMMTDLQQCSEKIV